MPVGFGLLPSTGGAKRCSDEAAKSHWGEGSFRDRQKSGGMTYALAGSGTRPKFSRNEPGQNPYITTPDGPNDLHRKLDRGFWIFMTIDESPRPG